MYSNIEADVLNNTQYRKVVYTTKDMQLVYMCLEKNEIVDFEKHRGTQFVRIESGEGVLSLKNGEILELYDGIAFIIQPNEFHKIENTGLHDLKFYTLYSPPEH